MKTFKTICTITLAACAFVCISCDKATPDNIHTLNGTNSVIRPDTAQASDFIETKAGNAPKLTNVYGSKEDDFMIEEYVSDIVDVIPETKGTIVTTDNIPNYYGSFYVNAYRPFSKAELSENDNVDNSDDVYDNGAKSASTKAVRDFSMTSSHSGSSWNWSGSDPHWRNKSVFSIWSMAPASSATLSPATMKVDGEPVTVPEPDWKNLSSIADVDPTGKTDDEIKAAEAARQEEIQSHFRSLEFDYALPAYAPTTNSTSIYKDLLFAYNEEVRKFEVEDGKLKVDPVTNLNVIKDGKPSTFNVHFYHALAAVKFELDTQTDGADIHSITLCYTDSGNISTNTGLATTGHCEVTGTSTASGKGEGSRKVDFAWTNQGGNKPMRFVFNDGTTSTTKVSEGYASTGDGVLFMIPQTASNLKVIVEFSKYGGTKYYTRVYNTGISVNWEAGKFYTYKLKIGEFHVPGELLDIGTRQLHIEGLKNASEASGMSAFSKVPKIKGVTAVGLLLADYACSAETGHYVYLMPAKNGVDPYAGKTGTQIKDGLANRTISYDTWTNIDFAYVDSRLTSISSLEPSKYSAAVDAIDYTQIYEFGLSPDEPETYHSLSTDFVNTGATNKDVKTLSGGFINHYTSKTQSTPKHSGPFYYACRIPENADDNPNNDVTTINYILKSSATSNNTGFLSYVLGFMVLEVRQDPSIPTDFSEFDWSTI